MKHIAITALIALAFTACKKDDDHSEDTPFSAVINVTGPAEGATINGGTTFTVTGTITANMEMHGYHVEVYKTAATELIYENEYHDHATSFTINETVTHSLADTTALKVVIEAAGDHEGSTVTKEIHLTYIP